VVFVAFRRDLLSRYTADVAAGPGDRVLFIVSAVVVVALVPALVSGIEVWIPAAAAAVVLVVTFAVRRPSTLRFSMVPWQVVLLASGLFLVVEAAHSVGLGTLLAAVSGTGTSPLDLLRLAATGAAGSNAVNNLPAYLALEPVAGNPARIAALLIGVNAGPLITPWASLATLLWHERLVGLGVHISWGRYAVLGVIVVPITIVLAIAALSISV
jgi:Na+/H+ antiporter NhaD/arsenite permease-like protein